MNLTEMPVGQVVKLEIVDSCVKNLLDSWNQRVTIQSDIPWWKFWQRKSTLHQVQKFLLISLDTLVQVLDKMELDSADKKATALAAVDKIYDIIIQEAMPIVLKPFGAQVKKFIVYIMGSSSIDWVVSKYRDESWRQSLKDAIKEEPAGSVNGKEAEENTESTPEAQV